MALVRQVWRAAGAIGCGLFAGACAHAPPAPPPPVPELATIDSSRVLTTVFLIGDAGAAASNKDRVLVELRRQGRQARRGSSIVFLGDNVYPRGIPDRLSDTTRFNEARTRLFWQAEIADSTGLRIVFVPGNHDWARQGEDGWASVQRAELLLREYAKERRGVRVEQSPSMGCPGPAVTSLARGVRLVAIDTQWWLHRGSRAGRATDSVRRALPDAAVSCAVTSEVQLTDSLKKLFHSAGDYLDIMVAHHPLATYSEHGGHFPWLQYLFPAVPTPIASWAWLPIGWIYPLGRRLVADRQDLVSKFNRAMRVALEGTFAADRPFLFASGHDHGLQVLRGGTNRYYLVSGAGIEDHQNSVGKSGATLFSASRPGFMRLDVFNRDSVRLGVTVITKQNTAVESYRIWLRR
jgi:hypothetical protein